MDLPFLVFEMHFRTGVFCFHFKRLLGVCAAFCLLVQADPFTNWFPVLFPLYLLLYSDALWLLFTCQALLTPRLSTGKVYWSHTCFNLLNPFFTRIATHKVCVTGCVTWAYLLWPICTRICNFSLTILILYNHCFNQRCVFDAVLNLITCTFPSSMMNHHSFFTHLLRQIGLIKKCTCLSKSLGFFKKK